jgi:L-alanine-DL-glutamate epimerase-like enolase superfamily enzyme
MRRREFTILGALAAACRGPERPRGVRPLRITAVKTVEVRGVATGKGLLLPWDPKRTPLDTRDYVVTQFLTDQGLVGTTIDGDYRLPEGIGGEIQRRAEAYFVGKDPFEIGRHQAEFFDEQQAPVRLYFLEIGLWDIVGKALGAPLYRLWGAATDRVRAYAATVHFDKTPEERAEDALKFREAGFRAIKLRLHHIEMKDDLRLAETVVRAVGDGMAVMVDANQAGNRRALDTARALEEMGVYWLEEPLARGMLDDLARLRAGLKRMHLAGGEGNRGFGEFREILVKGAFSYIQPDPVVSGPLSVVRKIAATGEAFGVLFGPHHGKSGVGMMANLHMQCAASNSGYLEYMYDPGYWNPEGFQVGFAAPYPVDKEGFVHAPQAPGLGIVWDPAFLKRRGLEQS